MDVETFISSIWTCSNSISLALTKDLVLVFAKPESMSEISDSMPDKSTTTSFLFFRDSTSCLRN